MLTPVKKGIMLLDEHAPGWMDKIDAKTLDLASCQSCILGQVFGNYIYGLHALNLSPSQGKEFGFNSHSEDRMPTSPSFVALKREWLLAIDDKGGKITAEERELVAV